MSRRSRIEFGVFIPQVAFGFDDILARALDCERLGYDSFWLFDHLYTPGLPNHESFEGWTLATALLARTERLRVGHLVTCNNFRHPALLAKMATTLDVISGGRLEFGLGSGSVEQEHLEAGLPWGSIAERSERLAEALEIVTRMFASPRTTFEGRHYAVRDLPNLPAPVQQPRPPIHVGGGGIRYTLPLVARYADVWNAPAYALDRLPELIPALDAECERIGRDPKTVRRSIEAVLTLAPDERLPEAIAESRRRHPTTADAGGFAGNPDVISARIEALVEQGFTSFIFFIHDRGKTETLELFAEEVMSRFR
jgi:F420-dependent oxidoreductase-like protein